MHFITFAILLTVITFQNANSLPEGRLCARSWSTVAHITEVLSEENDETSDGGGDEREREENMKWNIDPETGLQYVQCTRQMHHCYALWQEDSNGNGSIIMGQGCWESSGKQDCERSQCVSDKKPSKAMNNTKFCCCSGDFCNVNVTDIYVPGSEDTKIPPPATEYLEQALAERKSVIFWTTSSCAVLFVVAFIFFGFLVRRHFRLAGGKNVSHPDQVHLMAPGYTSGMYSVDHLKLSSIIGQGRYGSVWKGVVNEQEVAVKIFPAHYRTYFYNERDIYCLPFMDNPALLTYFGYDERTNMEGQMEYLLVLSYAPNGCLQDYLPENTIDFATFCKMSLSIAKGLAHLHSNFIKGDKIKPCVSHRDLNSRNILVKTDLSCCICDLGFALKISGSKYYHNGEEQHAETKSINEVGTRRYIAPEVLEGAVNLCDCETSLKQIDVYALGLVLWELATRCTEFYTVQELPAYQLPFQQEIGLHPTLEQMQTLVSRRKARPLFPIQWRDTAAARLVRDTAEDCWDQDAEARLTALCVVERLSELPLLRDRYHRTTIYSTSPTFNSNQSNGNIINNNNHLNAVGGSGGEIGQTPTIFGNVFIGGGGNSSSTGKDGLYDISDGTVETLISPSDPGEHTFKNSNQTAQYISNGLITNQFKQATVNVPLQPYQGRNPCLERNLMLPTDSTDNLQYSANLVDKSFKHTTHYRPNSNTTILQPPPSQITLESQGLITHEFLNQNGSAAEDGFNTITAIMNQNQIQNTNTNQNRPATPIPYVQNVVYDNLPKQHNTEPVKSKFRWNSFRKLIDRKLFGRNRLETVLRNEDVEEPKSNLISSDVLSKKPTEVNLICNGKYVNGIGVVTSLLQETFDNQTGTGNNKRPSTLPLPRSDSNPIAAHKLSIPVSGSGSDSDSPVPDLDRTNIRGSDSTSGISQLVRRKDHNQTLSKQQSLEQFNEMFSSASDLSRLKDPNQRIKTPGDVPPSVRRTRGKANVARFSLYDDRMMVYDKESTWSSVPNDIDVTVETFRTNTLQPPEIDALKCNNRDSVSSF